MAVLSRNEQKTASARRGQQRAMEKRKCPECGRGNALSRAANKFGPEYAGRFCRYCDYSTVRSINEIEASIRERNATPDA